MLLVNKNISVPSLSGLHVDHGLVGLLEWSRLHPRLNLLLDSKVKHVLDLLRGTDGTAANLDATGDESKGVDGRKLSAVRCAVNQLE